MLCDYKQSWCHVLFEVVVAETPSIERNRQELHFTGNGKQDAGPNSEYFIIFNIPFYKLNPNFY